MKTKRKRGWNLDPILRKAIDYVPLSIKMNYQGSTILYLDMHILELDHDVGFCQPKVDAIYLYEPLIKHICYGKSVDLALLNLVLSKSFDTLSVGMVVNPDYYRLEVDCADVYIVRRASGSNFEPRVGIKDLRFGWPKEKWRTHFSAPTVMLKRFVDDVLPTDSGLRRWH